MFGSFAKLFLFNDEMKKIKLNQLSILFGSFYSAHEKEQEKRNKTV